MLSGKKIVIIHNIHHCTACMKILESIAFFFFFKTDLLQNNAAEKITDSIRTRVFDPAL